MQHEHKDLFDSRVRWEVKNHQIPNIRFQEDLELRAHLLAFHLSVSFMA